MKSLKFPTLMLGGMLLSAPVLHAAEVNIQWDQPEKFRDIEAPSLANQKQYQQQVIDELGKHITAAANRYLAPDQQFNMTVTDIDLAGDVQYFFARFPQGIRIVDNLYFPRIVFSYELIDANGNVQMQGEANVKDMGFNFAGTRVVDDATLGYEKRMIDDWFKSNFGES